MKLLKLNLPLHMPLNRFKEATDDPAPNVLFHAKLRILYWLSHPDVDRGT